MGCKDISEETTFYEIDEISAWDWRGRAEVSKLRYPVSKYDTKLNAIIAQIVSEITHDIEGVPTTNDTFEFSRNGVKKVDGVEEILRRHDKHNKLKLALGDQNNDPELLV